MMQEEWTSRYMYIFIYTLQLYGIIRILCIHALFFTYHKPI